MCKNCRDCTCDGRSVDIGWTMLGIERSLVNPNSVCKNQNCPSAFVAFLCLAAQEGFINGTLGHFCLGGCNG